MAIIPDLDLPEWGDSGDPPSQDIIDNGWSAGDGVPSVWLNWFFYNVLKTLSIINQEAITAEAVEENLGTLPQDVENIKLNGRFYKKIPATATKLNQVYEEGTYYIPDIKAYSDLAGVKNPQQGDMAGSAILTVVNVKSVVEGSAPNFVAQRLFINDGFEMHVMSRRLFTLYRNPPVAGQWRYELTAAGGTFDGSVTFNAATQFNEFSAMMKGLNVTGETNLNGSNPLQFRKSTGKRWTFWLENGADDVKGDNVHFAPSATNGNADWDYTKGYSINTNTGLITFKNGAEIKGNGANVKLYGNDHTYMEFYPQGAAGSRQGYIGFPSTGSKEFNINATDTLRLSDKNGALSLGQLISLYNARATNNRSVELGNEVSGSGAAYIDFHTNTTPGRVDFDARIIANAVDSADSQQAILYLTAKDVVVQTLSESFSLSDLKQSGVDTKQKLVDALNAKRLASTTSEDFTTLINRIYTASTARDIGINGDAYTMNNYDGDFGTYTDPTGSGWRHSYASIFLYNVGNLIQFTPNIQYDSSAQFYLAAGGRGQITLRDDGERALDIFPMYTWQPSNAGSGNRILLQLYSFTLDKAQRKLTIIRDFANPSDAIASQPRQKFVVSVPSDFNLNGALRLRLNVGLPNGGYAANGQISGRLYY